jgi:hypothetical protein
MTHAFRSAAGALLLAGMMTGTAWGQGAPAQTAPAQPAQAAPQPGQAQPAWPQATEASRREARALGDKLGWESQVRSIINTLRTAIIVNLSQVNGKPPTEMQAVVDDLLVPDLIADAPALMNMIVEAWARAFTAEELRNLRSFYNTPLGEKLLRTIPQLNQVINQSGQAWAQRAFGAMQQKHAAEFTKRGLQFNRVDAAQPGAAPPAAPQQ